MATAGAIYVPRGRLDSLIENYNYMRTNDVALTCNGCDPLKKGCKNIVWLESSDTKTPAKRFSIAGTRTEWEAHNGYMHLLDLLIKFRDIYASDETLNAVSLERF